MIAIPLLYVPDSEDLLVNNQEDSAILLSDGVGISYQRSSPPLLNQILFSGELGISPENLSRLQEDKIPFDAGFLEHVDSTHESAGYDINNLADTQIPVDLSEQDAILTSSSMGISAFKALHLTNSIQFGSTMGPTGPAGPTGPTGPTDMSFAKRVDFISESLLYKGFAAPGTLDSNPHWSISRITIGSDGDVTEQFALGSDAFVNAWTDRLTLTYS